MRPTASDHRLWIRQALERYQRPLVQYAFRLTRDLERARDVVQDTFLRLCRESPESVGDHLAQWLYKVCRNRALDVLKKENRMTTLNMIPEAAWGSPGPDPGTRLEQQDLLQQVARVLDGLSDNQQEVVRLRFENGLSYREISRLTGLTVSNVGFLLHTALKNIREKVHESGAETRSAMRRVK